MKILTKRLAVVLLLMTALFISSVSFARDGSDAAEGSKFSRLKLEMVPSQIYDLIGQPTDSKTYETGKRWIPYYHGPDTRRTELIYRGEGRLTIGGNGRLINIVVDTSEDGYR